MENRKRKRGISLVHHQRSNSDLDQSVVAPLGPSQVSVTRLHYSRYPTSQTVRQVSAPKPNVSFCYGVGSQTSRIHLPQEMRSFRRENSDVFRLSHVVKEFDRSEAKDIETSYVDVFASSNERYESFEHCKQVIGKRLFGESTAINHQTVNKRHNYLQQYIHPQINIIPEPFRIDQKDQVHLQATIRAPLQNYEPSNLLQPTETKRESSLKASNKTLTIENTENIVVVPVRAEPQKPKKPKREPMNLNEMERRLREIIKICDQNI